VFRVRYEHDLKIKRKAIPVTGREGLHNCEMLRIPHCLDDQFTDGTVVSLTHRPHSAPQKHFFFRLRYSFVSDAE
jgi:hypothetical protein